MVAPLVLALALSSGTADAAQARELAKRSMVEYDAGDVEKALADAQRAYELDPLPGFLFNLGQCHRALHHWEQAEFSYRGYLRKKPDAKNRAAVEALIAEMQSKEKEAAASAVTPETPIVVEAPPSPPATPTSTPTPTPSSTAPSTPTSAPAAAVTAPAPGKRIPVGAWVMGGVGVAAAAVGVVFAVLASNLKSGDTYQNATNPTPYHTISQGQFNDEVNDAYLANGLIYGGAAVLVGGVLWGIFGRGAGQPSEPQPASVSF